MDMGRELANLRSLIDEKERLAAEQKTIQKRIDAAQYRLSDYCESIGVDQLKVDGVLSFSVSKDLRVVYDKDRWDELVAWAASTGNSHIVQRRISERPVKELMETLAGDFPAHLFKFDEYNKVSTRRI
jgi:hypothetical protein